jgi:hypothetical protein
MRSPGIAAGIDTDEADGVYPKAESSAPGHNVPA